MINDIELAALSRELNEPDVDRLIERLWIAEFQVDGLRTAVIANQDRVARLERVREAASLVLTASDIDNLHPEIWAERLRAALAAVEEPPRKSLV